MYTRIDIQWRIGYIRSSEGDALHGTVVIMEGDTSNNMGPRHPGKFEIVAGKNIISTKGGKHNLPETTEEEYRELIDLARTYYDGYFRKGGVSKWLKIGQ